jgi:hypothetical protein
MFSMIVLRRWEAVDESPHGPAALWLETRPVDAQEGGEQGQDDGEDERIDEDPEHPRIRGLPGRAQPAGDLAHEPEEQGIDDHDREAQAPQDQAAGDGQQERADRRVDHREQQTHLQHSSGMTSNGCSWVRHPPPAGAASRAGRGRHRDGVNETWTRACARCHLGASSRMSAPMSHPTANTTAIATNRSPGSPAFGQVQGEASAAAYDGRQDEDQNDAVTVEAQQRRDPFSSTPAHRAARWAASRSRASADRPAPG